MERHDAEQLIQHCGCVSGCPACVGPTEEVGMWEADSTAAAKQRRANTVIKQGG